MVTDQSAKRHEKQYLHIPDQYYYNRKISKIYCHGMTWLTRSPAYRRGHGYGHFFKIAPPLFFFAKMIQVDTRNIVTIGAQDFLVHHAVALGFMYRTL